MIEPPKQPRKERMKMSENENLSLEVFDNPEFGQMRILREGDKYLFCANDAAVALG